MPKILTDDAIASYHRDGFYFPVRVLSEKRTAHYRARHAEIEARLGGKIEKAYTQKTNLIFTWVDELLHEPTVLDAVEDVIGPDIVLWSAEFFIKAPGDKRYVSWHQDDTYWHLDPPIEVTAWIAVSDVPEESGPVRFIPGSHRIERYNVVNQPNPDNMLQSGQIAQGVDESKAVSAVLNAGELSLHHTKTLHASQPNISAGPRIGISARFIPTHVRQLVGRESAMLMRGVDTFRNFDPEPRPKGDLDAAALEAHRDAVLRHMATLRGSNYQAQAYF